MKSYGRVALVLLLASCSETRSSGAGSRRVIDGEPSCPNCRVELREIALLGGPMDSSSFRPDAAGRECMVGSLGSGMYVVSAMIGGGHLSVYDSMGALVRTIGRKGAGPGEFGSILRLAVGRDDTLFVMDDSNLRVQVLDPAGSFVRSFPAPGRFRSFGLLSNGDLLLFHPPTRVDDRPLEVLASDGSLKARFGEVTRPASEIDLEYWIASPRTPSGFWTANAWAYEVFRWREPDSLAESLVRDVSWFPANAPYPADPFQGSLPPASLVHVWEDTSGRLWTYSLVPDPNWIPGSPARPSPEWFRSTFDTMIEVIDISTGRLIASGSHDGRLGMVCGSELMYTVVETVDGDTRVQILSPALIEPR